MATTSSQVTQENPLKKWQMAQLNGCLREPILQLQWELKDLAAVLLLPLYVIASCSGLLVVRELVAASVLTTHNVFPPGLFSSQLTGECKQSGRDSAKKGEVSPIFIPGPLVWYGI